MKFADYSILLELNAESAKQCQGDAKPELIRIQIKVIIKRCCCIFKDCTISLDAVFVVCLGRRRRRRVLVRVRGGEEER